MENDSTKINVDAVNNAITLFQAATQTFEGEELKVSSESFFNGLISAGLDKGFVSSYSENNEALKSSLANFQNAISSTIQNMENLDQSVLDEIDDLSEEKPKRKNNNGSGNAKDNGTSQNSESQPQLVDNAAEQLSQYKNMSMNDLSNVAAEISKLADDNNATLEQVLSGKEYSLKIHNALLSSPNVSNDLKELIKTGDPSISQILLANIFAGNAKDVIGFNDNITNTIKTYLVKVAGSNNITAEQLLSDSNYSATLKNTLASFGGITNQLKNIKENIDSSLLNIYDGNQIENMTSEEVSIIRDFIDTSAKSNNTEAEVMLTSSATPKDDISNLGKASVFMNIAQKFSSEVGGNVLRNLLGFNK